jgi:hypothetical protein
MIEFQDMILDNTAGATIDWIRIIKKIITAYIFEKFPHTNNHPYLFGNLQNFDQSKFLVGITLRLPMQEKKLLQALPRTVHCKELSPGKGASHAFDSPRRFPMYQTTDAVTD